MRRLAVGSVAAALIVLVLAGCGGSEGSPSASGSASSIPAPATTDVPAASEASSAGPSDAPPVTGTVRMTSLCPAVGVRKAAATDGKLLVRIAKGAKVRVVETVTGDPYEAGTCGASGDDWIKIDRINGKSVQTLYGVPFGYAAGGFFE